MAEPNLIKSTDLARVREVDFVEQFTGSLKKFNEALGVTRKIKKEAGTTLKTYKAVGTLENGTVGEGETIPLSKFETIPVTYDDISLDKWRKATSAEAIVEKGYDQAVGMTTDKMLKLIQGGIMTNFFNFLATGTGHAVGNGLQGALAQTWGQLQVLFEDEEIDSVYFVNPLDIADYLESASITIQNAFGMKYVEDFMGLGTVILNSRVARGKVYGTAKENLVMYYVAVNGADLGEAFKFTADKSGYIGIHEEPDYDNMTAKDTVIAGIVFLVERIDGVVCGEMGELTAVTAEAVGTGDGSNKVFELDYAPYLGAPITIKVGGTATTEYTLSGKTVTFKTAPANSAAVTADYSYVNTSNG